MPDYRVRWEIDLLASDPVEAARQALAAMRDPTSIATCFEVYSAEGGDLLQEVDFHPERG